MGGALPGGSGCKESAMAESIWVLIGVAIFVWGAYLVSIAGYSRRDMERRPLRHHSGEPEF